MVLMIENKDWLYHEYIELCKSLSQISKEQNVSEHKVRYWTRKFELDIKQRKTNSKLFKNCKECNKEFKVIYPTQIFCNNDCASLYHLKQNVKKRRNYQECIICGKTLEYGNHREKFCSEECWKKHRRKYIKEKKKEYQKLLEDYKLSIGCSICGYNKCSISLDFHHLYGKDFIIRQDDLYSYLINGNKRVKKELDKCILVCKNCHGEIHYYLRRKDFKKIQEMISKKTIDNIEIKKIKKRLGNNE